MKKIPTELKHLIDTAVELAIESTQDIYAPYFAHQILLAFMWLNAETKLDLKAYFDALPTECLLAYEEQKIATCFPDAFLPAIHTVLNEQYSDKDLEAFEQKLNQLVGEQPKSSALHAYFLDHYEEMNALFGYIKDSFAPLLPGVVVLKFGEDQPQRGFTDCGEATVRNIMNIALFDSTTKKFDLDSLKNILTATKYKNNPHLASQDPLFKFYTQYNTIAKTYIPQSRLEWAKIVSGLPNVDYQIPDAPELSESGTRKISCEIKGRFGIINLIRVLEFILYGRQYEELSDLKASGFPHKKRLNQIFQTLSQPNKELTWRFETENNKWGRLIILINKKPQYSVVLEEKHLELFPLNTYQEMKPWVNAMFNTLLANLSEENKIPTLSLLSWVPHKKEDFKHTIPTVFNTISESALTNIEHKHNFFYWWLLTLEIQEYLTQKRILEALSNLNLHDRHPLYQYLQILHPTQEFIMQQIMQGKMQLVHFMLEQSGDQDLIFTVLQNLITYLTSKTKQEYAKLTWPEQWSQPWDIVIKKLSIDQLEHIISLVNVLEKKLTALDVKNKNILHLISNVETLHTFINTALEDKKALQEAGGITGLFEE